jgi:uncharacterized membrane protein
MVSLYIMKPEHLKQSFFHRLSLKESWIIFFILGIIMLNYPFLHIFNKTATLLTMPVLFLYFIVGWCISIIVIYLFTRTINTENNRHGGSPHK